jgi:deazaflavin-dependent oxidoreductase (nitroreductase family)
MPIPRRVAVFNKYITNRIILPFAGWLPLFAEVTHMGRRSGRVYRTPILAFAAEDGFVAALTYGRDVDWVKNLRALGGAIRQGGKSHLLASVRFMGRDEAKAYVPSPVLWFLSLLSVVDFVYMRTATETN